MTSPIAKSSEVYGRYEDGVLRGIEFTLRALPQRLDTVDVRTPAEPVGTILEFDAGAVESSTVSAAARSPENLRTFRIRFLFGPPAGKRGR